MMSSDAPILVTGGAGFLGINLCRYLIARGYKVRSLDIAAFDYPEQGDVEVIQGDIRDPRIVEQAMRGVSVVVHAAAALAANRAEEIFSIDVEGTRLLLEKAFHNNVSRFIFISTTAVYGLPDRLPSQEDDEMRELGPYSGAKIAAEKICLEWRERGACVPILRPKSFVGPERLGVWELLYDFAFEGRHFPVIGGNNVYQLLDVDDMCQAIYLCMTRDPDEVNDTFNVGAKEFGSMRENFQAVLDRAGYGKRVISLPTAPMVAVLNLLGFLRLSPIYKWIYETAARGSFDSTQKIECKLGFVQKYSNRAALIRNYDWYVANRVDIRGRTGISHRVPWKKGALRFAKWMF